MPNKPTAPSPWPGFKMKMFVHFATCPYYSFLSTLKLPDRQSKYVSRLKSYDRYMGELMADGLVAAGDNQAIPVLTAKGKVYADALLTLPLPVPTEPQWTMPGR